jgi:hypothetical protein
MGYRPPKGVRPPQLEGKRTGRPKGSRKGWSELLLAASDLSDDVRWAYQSRFIAPEKMPKPPTPFALVLSRLPPSVYRGRTRSAFGTSIVRSRQATTLFSPRLHPSHRTTDTRTVMG